MRLLMTAEQITADPYTWARTRDEHIGASDIGSVMGLEDAYSTPFDVWQRKTFHEDRPDRLALRIGRHFEPLVLELFAEAHPEIAVTSGGLYASTVPGREWQAATFDALGYAHNAAGAAIAWQPIPIQAKETHSFDPDHWGDPPHGEIPGPYLAQCLQEIDVAGAERAFLPVLPTGTRGALRVYEITRDGNEDDLAAMREAGDEFHQRLLSGDPPPVDWRPETTAALKRLHRRADYVDQVIPKRLGRRARAAYAAERLAKRRLGLVQNEIRARLGTATRAITGDPEDPDVIATRSVYTAHHLSVPELRAAHPQLAAEFTTETSVDKLLIKQPRGN